MVKSVSTPASSGARLPGHVWQPVAATLTTIRSIGRIVRSMAPILWGCSRRCQAKTERTVPFLAVSRPLRDDLR